MECPKCKFQNRDGAKFCKKCGLQFTIPCPKCHANNTPDSEFCDECGYNLTLPQKQPLQELSFDEKITKIQKYLPKGLTEKILSQRDRIEGERRQVTVMFCDMEGFTPLVEKLGPEEAYGIMDQVYEILIHKVHDYEGTVNDMTGDGIMALFGAPIALEDAPQRAIRSAMAIHQEITRYSDRMKQAKGISSTKIRIGIHTGPVVVGTLGNDLRVEFKAVGDTVNLASRIKDLAEAGTTYITEDTFKLTEGLFRFEDLGRKRIKGKEKPIRAYQVIATSTRRTRFDVSTERGLIPFVGRERELELLLDGYERIKEGRGQAYSIMGEAGVGKSRLLYEFRKVVMNEDATLLEGKCLSYGKGVAYHPIIDILKTNFDIHENENDQTIREKVTAVLNTLKMNTNSTLPYFLELLSVKDSGIEAIQLSPEGKKERIIESLRQITLKGAEISPIIMVIEDLHWVDKTTEEALMSLLESVPGTRLLLIFTYRPEYVHTWGGKSYHNQVNLNRLSNRESLLMSYHMLRTKDIGRELEEMILTRTEGIPFFIEEFIKSLKDLKIIECKDGLFQITKDLTTVTIPSTIHDVIMARVDSLPQGAKEVLQTGSAIEREFSHALIRKVTHIPEEELLSHLSILKDAELLYDRGIYPHNTYIFKHALTREVVYDSILTKKKKVLHEDIGNAMEEIYKDNLDEYYGVLTEHFIASENYEKGAEYSRLTSRKASRSSSVIEAVTYARRRIFCIEKLPQKDDWQRKQIDARTVHGLFLLQTNRYVDAKEAIDPILEVAKQTNYRKRLRQLYIILGSHYFFIEEDMPRALNTFNEAIEISKEVNDVVSVLFENFWLGAILCFDCNFDEALSCYQRNLDIYAGINSVWGVSLMKASMGAWCYFYLGKFDQQNELSSSDSVCMAEEIGDPFVKNIAYLSYGRYLYGKGIFEEAEKHLLKAVEFNKSLDLATPHALAHQSLAEFYYDTRDYEKSKEYYERAVEVLERNQQLPSWLCLFNKGIIRSRVMNNEKNVDLNALYVCARDNKMKNIEGFMARYIGDILLNIDDQHMSEAEHWIQKGIEADERSGMRFYLAKDYARYAEWYKRNRNRAKAQENLGKAIEIYKECGADGWVTRAEKELASL